jgi:hypothetical protein
MAESEARINDEDLSAGGKRSATLHDPSRQPSVSRAIWFRRWKADKHYRAPAHFEKPSRLIKNENAFKSADEVKLNRTETIAFRSE